MAAAPLGQTGGMTTPEASARPNPPRRQSEHFFAREPDGSVRLRIRFDGTEASMMEEAAGDTPLLNWIHQTLSGAARSQVEALHRARPEVGPPTPGQ